MKDQFRKTLASGLFFASVLAFPAAAADLNASSPLVKGCEVCHGERGESHNTNIPRLNGQKSEYILTRLKEFLDRSRNTPHGRQMAPIIAALSDSDAEALAQYFSRQTPSPRISSGIQSTAGAEIYLHGADPAIPACATCHGPTGDGLGGTPRVAGQHGAYLLQQLGAFNSSARIGTAMNRHTWDMTLQQMQELSAYLANN